jgi:DNA modification methylase
VASGKRVADYRPARRNANKHTARGLGALQQSVQTDGWIGAMTAAADGEMIAGSARIETVAQVFGTDAEPIIVETDGTRPVLVVRTDIPHADDKRAQRLALADNRVQEMDLTWDVEVLAGFDADVLGELWTPEELSDLGQQWADEQRGKQEDAGAQVDKAEELRVKWGVESGQLWQLGEHRLICGDCTDAATVANVMGGERAAMTFTSPPYNAGVSAQLSGNTSIDDNLYKDEYDDNKSQPEYLDLLQRFTVQALEVSDYVFVNLQFLAGNKTAFIDYLAGHKAYLADIAIWDKQHAAPQQAQRVMDSRFEFVVILSHTATRAVGTREFRGMVHNLYAGSPQRHNEYAASHAATFPVDLPEHFIGTFTNAHEVIFEPFNGTGTTLIACERLGRKCRAVEISPGYCAVALERWAQTTGKTPILANGD